MDSLEKMKTSKFKNFKERENPLDIFSEKRQKTFLDNYKTRNSWKLKHLQGKFCGSEFQKNAHKFKKQNVKYVTVSKTICGWKLEKRPQDCWKFDFRKTDGAHYSLIPTIWKRKWLCACHFNYSDMKASSNKFQNVVNFFPKNICGFTFGGFLTRNVYNCCKNVCIERTQKATTPWETFPSTEILLVHLGHKEINPPHGTMEGTLLQNLVNFKSKMKWMKCHH